MEVVKYAPAVFRGLNGIFCVYKPPRKSIAQVAWTIRKALAAELNNLPTRPVRKSVVFSVDSESNNPTVSTVPDLSDHPLVVGPRYQPEFFDVTYLHKLPDIASGVQIMGIGTKKGMLKSVAKANLLRVYQIEGVFGRATKDGTMYSNTIEQTTFKHVTLTKLERVLMGMQGGHRRNAFYSMNIHQQSQEAYEIAAQGLVRPMHSDGGTVIYGLKCIRFHPPDFTLEIHSCNETIKFLAFLVHEIGIELRSSATCVKIRRLRYGDFTLNQALLQKHWNSQNIRENIDLCLPLVENLYEDGAKSKNMRPSVNKTEYDEGTNTQNITECEDFYNNLDFDNER